MSRLMCPHCYAMFAMREAPFRCVSEAVCDEPDQALAKHLGTAVQYLPRVFPGGEGVTAHCPQCDKESTMRVCPACHCELPSEMARMDNPIVSVHGDTGSGKSIFLAVSLHELPLALANLGGDMRFECAHTDEVASRMYVNPLYREHRAAPGGDIGNPEYALRRALVYRLKTHAAPRFFGGPWLRRERLANLAIYDSVGGQHNDMRTLQLHTQQVPHAKAFIILIDPVCYDIVRSVIDQTRARNSMVEKFQDALAVINRIVKYYRAHHERNVRVPTAFVMTKLDAFDTDLDGSARLETSPTRLYPPLKVLLEETDHGRRFNLRHCERASRAVQELLQAWGGGDIVAAARNNFDDYIFLAVSALGQPPETRVKDDGSEERVVEVINPRRVAEPWLWVLHRLGLLEAA